MAIRNSLRGGSKQPPYGWMGNQKLGIKGLSLMERGVKRDISFIYQIKS